LIERYMEKKEICKWLSLKPCDKVIKEIIRWVCRRKKRISRRYVDVINDTCEIELSRQNHS